MSNAEQASEPSMEDILSSIRKILDDEPGDAASPSDKEHKLVAAADSNDPGASPASTPEAEPAAQSHASTDSASVASPQEPSPFEALMAASQSSTDASGIAEDSGATGSGEPAVTVDPLDELINQVPEPIDAPKPVLSDKLATMGRIDDDVAAAPSGSNEQNQITDDEAVVQVAPQASDDSTSLTDRLVPPEGNTGAKVIATMDQGDSPVSGSKDADMASGSDADEELPLSDLLKSLAGDAEAKPPAAAPEIGSQHEAGESGHGNTLSDTAGALAGGALIAAGAGTMMANGSEGNGNDDIADRVSEPVEDPLESLLAGLPGSGDPDGVTEAASSEASNEDVPVAGKAVTANQSDDFVGTQTGENGASDSTAPEIAPSGATGDDADEVTGRADAAQSGDTEASATSTEPAGSGRQSRETSKDSVGDGFDTASTAMAVTTSGGAKTGIVSGNVKTMEDTVSELLRPMLRTWLDDNMPRILEKTLRMELASAIEPDEPEKKDDGDDAS